jgi:hypothetical protein
MNRASNFFHSGPRSGFRPVASAAVDGADLDASVAIREQA